MSEPWAPRTMDSSIREQRYGSSPYPSWFLPSLGSRFGSTTSVKIWWTPMARAFGQNRVGKGEKAAAGTDALFAPAFGKPSARLELGLYVLAHLADIDAGHVDLPDFFFQAHLSQQILNSLFDRMRRIEVSGPLLVCPLAGNGRQKQWDNDRGKMFHRSHSFSTPLLLIHTTSTGVLAVRFASVVFCR